MAVEQKTDLANKPFILFGPGIIKSAQTVAQDAGRTTDMEFGTVMAYNPTTELWEPFTDETATDGTGHPQGFLQRTLETADIVAGDVDDVPILVGDACVDEDQIVIENSLTLATICNVPAGLNKSVEQMLRLLGLFAETTIDTTAAA